MNLTGQTFDKLTVLAATTVQRNGTRWRVNVDGNYEPDNCRWATAKEQMQNTRARQ